MSAFNMSMFESIKGALASDSKKQSKFSEIIQCKPGNTYTVRLLPYSPSPVDTFFHYYNMGWVSFANGQYVQTLSPQTFEERCPIQEERFRLTRMGTDEEKEKANALRRMEKWLVNVFVVDDPTNPDNNGKVKLLRYGKQLQKIIHEAIEGEDSEEFGAKVFDLSDNGVNFKVKVEQQGDYPTYVSSRFTSVGKLGLDEEKQKSIYDSVHNLKEVFTLKSTDELKQMLDEHFHVRDSSTDSTPVVESTSPPFTPDPVPVAEPTPAPVSDTSDADIDDLLADL